MLRHIRWGALFVFILIWFLGPHAFHSAPPENSCNFVQNVALQRVSWKGDLPVHLQIHKSVPQEAYPAIQHAIDDYKNVMGREMFVVDNWGFDGPPEPEKDGRSKVYWMKVWEPERAREQARTTLYWNGNQIYEADIRVNAANFRFNLDDGDPRSAAGHVDLESLMIHELGHVLGLTHDPTHGSVMNFSLNDGEIRRHFGSVDLASLHCEY